MLSSPLTMISSVMGLLHTLYFDFHQQNYRALSTQEVELVENLDQAGVP